jgi:hypothetical protein
VHRLGSIHSSPKTASTGCCVVGRPSWGASLGAAVRARYGMPAYMRDCVPREGFFNVTTNYLE